MEFKGTKGKWAVEINKDYPTTHEIWSNHTYIARTCFAPSSEANALLISKAPEMLEMLELACMELESGGKKHWDIYGMMKALIKQATEIE